MKQNMDNEFKNTCPLNVRLLIKVPKLGASLYVGYRDTELRRAVQKSISLVRW